MRIFISQPMDGKTFKQLLEERKVVEGKIISDFGNNVEFINSLFLGGERNPLRSLSRSLSLLADADGVVFIEGWFGSRGCYLERLCCLYYDIPILKTYSVV